MRALITGTAALLVLASGCSGSPEQQAVPPSPSGATDASPPPVASPAPRPAPHACHRLTWRAALAPTDDSPASPCAKPHTSQTYAVGRLRTVVDGHLVAVDSRSAQRQVATTCPRRLSELVGGTEEQLRLSMLRSVWFTPSLEDSDAGAHWYRCDAIVVAGSSRLARLDGRLADVLETEQGRDAYGMCGTAQPGADDFERVACGEPHSWRAISTVDLEGRAKQGGYPGQDSVRDAGQDPCESAGRDAADDALDFQWGYEWPTREQWRSGQTYGRCWAPGNGGGDGATGGPDA